MSAEAKTSARLPFRGGRPPHLPCGPGDVAADVLTPGDPDRVALLAAALDEVQDFGRRREFAAVTGRYRGRRLTICSTGIGGPSTEIALVELAMLGARRVIRIGGMSALVPEIGLGEFLSVTDAIGRTGAAAIYREIGGRAEATPRLAAALAEAAGALGLRCHRGRVASTDSYYHGQDRRIALDGPDPQGSHLDAYLAEGALGVEMECQITLTVGRALGLEVGALLGAHGNRATDAWLDDYEPTQRNLLSIAGHALSLL
jgi:uridine phosphorylase